MQHHIRNALISFFSLASTTRSFSLVVTTASFGRCEQWKKSILRSGRRSLFPLRSSSGGGGIGFDGLSSALSKIESRQLIEGSMTSPNKRKENRWEKIILDNNSFSDDRKEYEDPFSTSPEWNSQEQAVYLLKPPNSSTPKSIILFLGGAVLGSYPHIAYSELLHRISDKTNAAVLAVPYPLGLNHFELSKSCEKLFQKAITYMDEKIYPQPSSTNGTIDSLPVYVLGHSLGCKLHLIRMAAVKNSWENLKGIGFISFNNYGLPQSVSMAKSFASALNGEAQKKNSNDEPLMDMFFNFVEQAAQGIGFDFSPNPTETERMIRLKFTDDLQEKCRMFQFDQDDLDCTEQFMNCCSKPSVSVLPGTHLTPVYLKFGVTDLPETTQILTEQLTDFQSASFGNEKQLDMLVGEVCSWMDGAPFQSSRKPAKDVATLRIPSNFIDV